MQTTTTTTTTTTTSTNQTTKHLLSADWHNLTRGELWDGINGLIQT